MKIYVSAKFSDKERVKKAYQLLKDQGHTITHEWVLNKQSFPFDLDPTFTAKCAKEDFTGVINCDVFILFSNEESSLGASGELGAAIALHELSGKPTIFVVGPHFNANFCFWHPAVQRINDLQDAIDQIKNQ